MEKQYTIKEVCQLLGITRQALYKWEKQGKIKFNRLFGNPRIAESELKKMIKEGE